MLEERMDRVLPFIKEKKVKLITNMGAANPLSAAKAVKKSLRKKGFRI